jgi:uncharacterized protein
MASTNQQLELAPVKPSKRIVEIDMIRGFALLGVILMNVRIFGADSDIWTSTVNEIIDWFQVFFFRHKSFRLFSLLFGFGFGIQLLRAKGKSKSFYKAHIRRIFILYLFGIFSKVFFLGEVLLMYAQLALVLLLIHSLKIRILVIIACIFFVVGPTFWLGAMLNGKAPVPGKELINEEQRMTTLMDEAENKRTKHIFVTGNFLEISKRNLKNINFLSILNWQGRGGSITNLALFIFGFVLARVTLQSKKSKDINIKLKRYILIALLLGLVANFLDWYLSGKYVLNDTLTAYVHYFKIILWQFGVTALSLGYAGIIYLLAQSVKSIKIVKPLAAMGRSALTNYLMQSIFIAILFYNYGFKLYYRIGPASTFCIALTFFTLQVAISNYWLKYFRYGPFEWLWRSLTYWKIQPFKK